MPVRLLDRVADHAEPLFPIAPRKRAPLTVLSNGSGQDSTAVIVRIGLDRDVRHDLAPQDLMVVGVNTGNEHPETLEHVEWLRDFCDKHGIEYHFITNDMGYHTAGWMTLETQFIRNSSVGSKKGFRRSCTDNLKLVPAYAFLEDVVPERYGIHIKGGKRGLKAFGARYGPIDMLIMFAADETRRVPNEVDLAKDKDFMKVAVHRRYPLIEWGWTRVDCQNYLRSVGAPVPVPSQCMFCHFKSEADLVWTQRFYPDAFEAWATHEERKLAKFAGRNGPNHGVFGAKTLRETLAEAQALYGHLTDEQLRELRNRGHRITNSL